MLIFMTFVVVFLLREELAWKQDEKERSKEERDLFGKKLLMARAAAAVREEKTVTFFATLYVADINN